MSADEVVVVRLPLRGAELWSVLRSAGRSLTGATRVVVLKGEGSDFFRDEADVETDVEADVEEDAFGAQAEAVDWLRRPDLITIAAITGAATAAGLLVALCCDFRVAADDASLAMSHNLREFQSDAAVAALAAARLVDAVGYAQALELALTGRRLSGRQAAACGLVNLGVPAGDIETAVSDLVTAVLSTPRTAATGAKALLTASAQARHHLTAQVAAGLRLAERET